MPERWQHELKKLRRLEPPDRLWDRVKEGPRGEPPGAPRTGRAVAAVVAFVIFAVGGAFAWNAFGGGTATVAPVGSPDEGLVRITVANGGDGRLAAVLRSGSVKSEGAHFPARILGEGGAAFSGDDIDRTLPPQTFVPIARDAVFNVAGSVRSDTLGALWLGAKRYTPPRHLLRRELIAGQARWDLGRLSSRYPEEVRPGGRYVLALMGRTVSGTPFGFTFGVQVKDPVSLSEPPTTPADISNVAVISCTGPGTELLTPVVRPQADGVHFEVDNQAQTRAIAGWREGEDGPHLSYWAFEFDRQDVAVTKVFSLDPGRYFVQCIDTLADSDRIDLRPEEAQPLEIVDADAVWFPNRLSCSGGSDNRMLPGSGAADPFTEPEQFIRDSVPGIRQTDVVGPAGYPEATRGGPWQWRIERDGKVIALLRIIEPEPTIIMVTACAGSGIAEKH